MEIVIAVLASFAVVSILAWFLCKNEIKHVSRQMEQELAKKKSEPDPTGRPGEDDSFFH